jgi:hypothetical protein
VHIYLPIYLHGGISQNTVLLGIIAVLRLLHVQHIGKIWVMQLKWIIMDDPLCHKLINVSWNSVTCNLRSYNSHVLKWITGRAVTMDIYTRRVVNEMPLKLWREQNRPGNQASRLVTYYPVVFLTRKILFFSFIILWNIDPLLVNDRETNNETAVARQRPAR